MKHASYLVTESTSPSPHAAECMAKIREIMSRPVPRGTFWAKQIMSRIAAGAHVSPTAYDLAKAALGPVQEREPGQDDEEKSGKRGIFDDMRDDLPWEEK